MSIQTSKSESGKRKRKTTQWVKEDILVMIQACERSPSLWDVAHPQYSDRILRMRLLSNIAELLDKDVMDVNNKWQNLRSQFNAERRKFQRSGTKCKWKFYKLLNFLTQTPGRPTGITSCGETSSCDITDNASSEPLEPLYEEKEKVKKEKVSEQIVSKEALLKHAVNIIQKKQDGEQIFGDYVAQKLRNFPQQIKDDAQLKIERILMEATEATINSSSYFSFDPLQFSVQESEGVNATQKNCAIKLE